MADNANLQISKSLMERLKDLSADRSKRVLGLEDPLPVKRYLEILASEEEQRVKDGEI